MSGNKEIAILGGGCFWCIEAAYAELAGVSSAISGYCGGHVANPSYEAVCGKCTGHIEVVKIEFDSLRIPYRALLEMFFTLHDPTTLDRQGNDVGPQYRSAIFCQSTEQRMIAEGVIAALNASAEWGAAAVTELRDPAPFYPAENYHQAYFRLNGHQPYCSYVVAPKIAKFRKHFAAYLKTV